MPEEFENVLRTVLFVVLKIVAIAGPLAFLFTSFYFLSLPLRRRQRAREFIDLLELGMEQGGGPEKVIVHAAATGDRALNSRFHRVAALLRGGVPLGEGLKKVPRLLPPQVTAMLLAGIEAGDLRLVLPLCRQTLNDAVSQTRGALNYLAVLTFVILPIVPLMSAVLSIFVVPKFEMIARDMEVQLPAFSSSVFANRNAIVWFQIFVMLGFQLLVVCYIGGPRLRKWFGGALVERLLWRLPWRRKRIQRDFGSMIAMLLDAGIPEQRAVILAGNATASTLVARRASAAAEEIARGVKLTEALRGIDGSEELHWRIRNAAAGTGGFTQALRGWIDVLDARAFQQEQSAAQTLTTLLVLWNGLAIGLFVVAVFGMLTNIIEGGVLW